MAGSYNTLEPKIEQQFGQLYPGGSVLGFNPSAKVDLYGTTSFLFVTAFMLIAVATGAELVISGARRLQASDAAIQKSREGAWRAVKGFVGVLSIFVLLYTANKGMLRGDVGLEELRSSVRKSGGMSTIVPTTSNASSNTASRSCDTAQNVITKLSSQNGICGGVSCSALAGCAYQQYLPLIESEASRQGVDKNLVIAILCTESRGRKDASNQNPNGTYDCGLMQINRRGPCDESSFDPATNIATGVTHLKNVVSSASAKQVYPNIPPAAGIGATYNCCSNGTVPNAPSVDCTQAAGFPYTIPKWACPINPGEGQFNMCAVKAYGCGVAACVRQLSGVDL